MKVTLPSHLPLTWVFSFVFILWCVQIVEGTTLWLSLTSCAIIIVCSLAFNAAGGLMYPSGAYIFFNGLFSGITGIVVKTVIGEPLQTNLISAQTTLLVYLVGMCSMLGAALLNRRIRRSKPFLTDRLDTAQIKSIAMGCVLLYLLPPLVLPDKWASSYVQFNYFHYLAIMLPVYQMARDTDGRRTFNWISFSIWFYVTLRYGILIFSKEGIFGASAVWAISALAAGYRVSLRKGLILGVLLGTSIAVLTPYSQIGRVYRDDENRTEMAIHLLTHPFETRNLYSQEQGDYVQPLVSGVYRWTDHPEGLFDRLTLVPVDDVLIYVTDHGQGGSLSVLGEYFANLIPHYLYPDKPLLRTPNLYGHEIGALPPDDDTTGVSFTPYADAYHVAHWQGLTIVLAPMFLLLFYVADSLTGSILKTRWSLLYFFWFAHQAAEGMMSALIYGAGTFSLVIIVAQAATTRIGPLLGAMAVRSGRSELNRA